MAAEQLIDRETLLAALLISLEKHYLRAAHDGFEHILTAFRERDPEVGATVHAYPGGRYRVVNARGDAGEAVAPGAPQGVVLNLIQQARVRAGFGPATDGIVWERGAA